MYSRFFVAVSATLAAIIVLGLALKRWNGPEIRRPLLCDERTTLEYYTWAGLAPSGEPHPLRRDEDFHTLPPVDARQLGMGIYRSLGVWTDTNNHVFHSLLVNFAIAGGHPDERTVRIPALLGAIIASFLAYWVCRRAFGWTASAPLVAIAVFCLPYLVRYSQEARGYSWMIALLFLQLGLMYRLARRPDSIAWAAACAFTAVLTFTNLVTLSLDWLLPLYVALMIYPPIPAGARPFSLDEKRVWRRSLLVQLLVFGSIGMVFLIDRLPYVYSTMNKYGDSFTGVAGYLRLLAQPLHFLFPGLVWEIVAIVGLVGVLAMLFIPSQRPLGAAIAFTLAINLGHFWFAGKFPPERSCGYLLPLALIGAGYLVEIALARIPSTGWRYALYGGLSAAVVGLAFLSLHYPVHNDERNAAIPLQIAEQEGLERTPAYAVLPAGPDTLRGVLPKTWIDPSDPIPDHGEINLVYCLADREELRLSVEEGVNERIVWRQLNYTPKHQTRSANGCLLAWQRMAVKPLRPETETPLAFPTLIVWRPAPERLGLDGSAVRKHIARFEIPYLQRNLRVPAKLSFFSRLNALEFLPQSTAEAEKTMAAVKEGITLFGGSAWLFQPLPESGN